MRGYRIIGMIAISCTCLLGDSVARAAITAGASFGYTHTSFPHENVTTNAVGIPGREQMGQPGMRLSYLAPGRLWDLNLDVGLERLSSSSFHETMFGLLPQFQLNAPAHDGLSPFANVGVGIEYETDFTFRSISATRVLLGAGAGLRKSVSDGHGFVRIEIRYDHVPKVEKVVNPFESFTFLARDMISVRAGFDLLLSR